MDDLTGQNSEPHLYDKIVKDAMDYFTISMSLFDLEDGTEVETEEVGIGISVGITFFMIAMQQAGAHEELRIGLDKISEYYKNK